MPLSLDEDLHILSNIVILGFVESEKCERKNDLISRYLSDSEEGKL